VRRCELVNERGIGKEGKSRLRDVLPTAEEKANTVISAPTPFAIQHIWRNPNLRVPSAFGGGHRSCFVVLSSISWHTGDVLNLVRHTR